MCFNIGDKVIIIGGYASYHYIPLGTVGIIDTIYGGGISTDMVAYKLKKIYGVPDHWFFTSHACHANNKQLIKNKK